MVEPIVSINFEDSRVTDVIAQLQSRVADLTQPHQEIGEYLVGKTDEHFRTETDPYGVPWLPNSPKTIAAKQAEGKILKILQRTGHMRSTVNYKATSNQVVLGISDRKARKHQLGIGVPKREILGISDRDIEAILEVYEDYFDG